MRRRFYLRVWVGVSLLVLGGCIGDDADSDPTPTPTPTPEPDSADILSDRIEDEGIDVISVTLYNGDARESTMEITFQTPRTDEDAVTPEIQMIAEAYASYVEDGHPGDVVYVFIEEPDGEHWADVEIRREWAMDYNLGQLSITGYLDQIMASIQFPP